MIYRSALPFLSSAPSADQLPLPMRRLSAAAGPKQKKGRRKDRNLVHQLFITIKRLLIYIPFFVHAELNAVEALSGGSSGTIWPTLFPRIPNLSIQEENSLLNCSITKRNEDVRRVKHLGNKSRGGRVNWQYTNQVVMAAQWKSGRPSTCLTIWGWLACQLIFVSRKSLYGKNEIRQSDDDMNDAFRSRHSCSKCILLTF